MLRLRRPSRLQPLCWSAVHGDARDAQRAVTIAVLALLAMSLLLHPLGTTAAPAAQLAESPSPMFRGNQRHTGLSAYVGTRNPTVRWVYDTGKRDGLGGWETAAAIGPDGTVYAGANDGLLYAFHGATGRLRWTFDTRIPFFGIYSAPALGADGTLYFGSKRRVYALTPPAADGGEANVRWSLDVVDMQTSPVLADDGTLYLAVNDTQSYEGTSIVGALRAPPSGTRPQVVWDRKLPKGMVSSPALANGVLFFGGFDGHVYALDASTGSERWKTTIGSPVEVSPAISEDGILYIGANDGIVYALDSGTGAERWRFETRKATDGIFSSPAIGVDGTVYIGANDGYVYALNGQTGGLIWEFSAGLPVLSSPTVDPTGAVYVGSDNGILYALRNGRVLWILGTEGAVLATPVIGADGTVYFGSMDGKFFAVGP